jgi:uracil-DNA glycosylase family 4
MTTPLIHVPADCHLCPRLVAFRAANAQAFSHFFNGAVPAFGALDAEVLVVGLAPGLRGANATGRPFTGDFAGDVLYGALLKHGLATGDYAKHASDGLALQRVRITNAVRCVPPENKPIPAEIKQCNGFLKQEIVAMPNLKLVLALGSVSHGAVLRACGMKLSEVPFSHGAENAIEINERSFVLLSSYHTSRYNIQTHRLTIEMFDVVIERAKKLI